MTYLPDTRGCLSAVAVDAAAKRETRRDVH
jgi:hypothetical protein